MKYSTTRRHTAIVLSALMSIQMLGCDSPEMDSTALEQADRVAVYDGEEIFRALVFGQGQLAQEISVQALDPRNAELARGYLEETHAEELGLADADSASVAERVVDDIGSLAEGHPEATELSELHKSLAQSASAPETETRLTGDELVNAIVDTIYREDEEFFDRFAADMQSGDHVMVESAMVEAASKLAMSISTMADEGLPVVDVPKTTGAGTCIAGPAVVVVAVAVAAVAAVNVYFVYNTMWNFTSEEKKESSSGIELIANSSSSDLSRSRYVSHVTYALEATD